MSFLLVALMTLFLGAVSGAFFTAIAGADEQSLLPTFLIGSSIGAGMAGVGSCVSYFFGGSIVALLTGAKPVSRDEDAQLVNIIDEMAIAAGIPSPAVYLIEDGGMNAFATGRDPKHALVGVTRGLREKLNREELQAVVAHEVAHIKNYDTQLMMLVGVFAGVIVLLADLFTRSLRSSGRSRSRSNKDSGGITIIFVIIGVVLSIIAPIIAKLLQLAVSREREYLADATAVRFCRNPVALASALEKIAGDVDPLEGVNRATEHMFIMNPNPTLRAFRADQDSMWSTHPPVSKRIMRLQQLAGIYAKQ